MAPVHQAALFDTHDRGHAFDHPFWRIVAPGVSNRKLWEILRSETYTFAPYTHGAPELAGWFGIKHRWLPTILRDYSEEGYLF